MPAALPPVNDCNCSCASSSGGSSSSQWPYTLHGTLDPNTAGTVPPYRLDLVWEYDQWLDAISGPPFNTWKWNPYLSVWQ